MEIADEPRQPWGVLIERHGTRFEIEIRGERDPVVVGPAIASHWEALEDFIRVLEPHQWGNLRFTPDGRFHVGGVPRDERTTTDALVAMVRIALEPEESKAGLIVVNRTHDELAETLTAWRTRWAAA
jgi:hypothetical protein